MPKKILFAILLVITLKSFSQQKLLRDSMIIDNSAILIATSSEHKEFEFCISKPKDIARELDRITYGHSQEAPFEKNPVVIKLVSKGLIVQTWTVKPKASVIEINNKKYHFDI